MSVQSLILQDENKTTVTHSWQAWPKLTLYCKPVGGGNQAAMAGFHPAHMYTILCAPPKAEMQQWSNVFYTNSASVLVQGLAGAGEEAEEEARDTVQGCKDTNDNSRYLFHNTFDMFKLSTHDQTK